MHNCESHKHDCQDAALARAEEICQQKGVRLTDVRRKVLGIVWDSHGPSKAYDILKQLGDGDAKPPTVYRALDFLQENGLVHKLNSLNAYVGCSHPEQHDECYFLICSACGEFEECCNPQLSYEILQTANRHKFTPSLVTVEIEGTCDSCETKPQN
jgi:Fur family zinc uptake transcriptional regulator